ncbi:MAG TPA: VWA domain-containing protein [Blastocatellia bacterium]|nr:VWA domain-containing protein [Blastocatellia bacterium]
MLSNTVRFCRALRDRGIEVTPAEVVAALRTLHLVDRCDRRETFLGLRGVLTTRVEEFPVFEELFDEFWAQLVPGEVSPVATTQESRSVRTRPVPVRSREVERKGLSFFLKNWSASAKDSEPLNLPGASNIESHSERDFSRFSSQELQEIARLARRIVRKLASRPSRRWKPTRRGQRVDLRRSIRASLRTGGELAELSYKQRKRKKTRLVVICDVSGSMDMYSRLLVQFAYAVQNSRAQVETFVFSTRVERITGHLKNKAYQRALELLGETRGWSGGTLIGPSLRAFNSGWPTLVDRRTIVILMSDGWDTGEPEELDQALTTLKRRAGRLIWLNPLLDSPGYKPTTRGMQVALPHIDVFAALNNLESLRALERHLVL